MSQILQMPGVPESSKQMLLRLLQEDLLPLGALKAVVESYRRVIHDAHRKNGRANFKIGDQIAHALQTMLARVNETTGNDNLRILQSAVRYFVIQNDGTGHDLETEDGLNDDARVVSAVMHYFGRDDLKVKGIPEPVPSRPQPVRGGAALPVRR
ncbi:MAG: hypothetical protein JNJ59_15570 [Deltaproteobacteria bacterium]|jgi:hypothetical protein|nr:hypothetical protein [Deltaproteobacteria bacterium]